MFDMLFAVVFLTHKIDRSITEVHMILDKKYQFRGEAFVMFESVEDVELALWSVTNENKTIRDKSIKVSRSSREHFQTYCDDNTYTKLSLYLKNGQIIPMNIPG